MINIYSEITADLLVHVARRSSQCTASTLTSAQWAALRFFAHSNRLSRLPSVFARYHGTTKGTASQTIKSLVKLGYLQPDRDLNDNRSIVYDLSVSGMDELKNDPLNMLVDALNSLPEFHQKNLRNLLLSINKRIKSSSTEAQFGTCFDCQYYTEGSGGSRCNKSDVKMTSNEPNKLCSQFRASINDEDI